MASPAIAEQTKTSGEAGAGNEWKQMAFLLAGVSFFGNGTLGITKALFSVLLNSLGFSGVQIGLISGARGFKAIADIPAGYLSDKYGRKAAAYIGQFLLVISHWMMGLGSTFSALFTARLLHGAGSGFNAGAATFGAADLTKRARGLGQGILETVNYGAHTAFAATAGILAVHYGMRFPFFALGLAPVAGAIVVWKFLDEPRDVAEKNLPHHRINLTEALSFGRGLLANPGLLTLFYIGMLAKFVDDGLLTMLMPLWLKSQGAGIGQIALVATLTHGTFTCTVALAGLFADVKGRKNAIIVGVLVLVAATLAMPQTTALVWMAAVSMTIAFGNSLIYPAVPAATADIVPDHLRAIGMSVYKFTHDAGVFIGPAVLGLLADRIGLRSTYFCAAAIIGAGALSLVLFYKEHNARKGQPLQQ